MYPEVKGISIRGKKQGNFFVQGKDITVITKLGIEQLPPDVEALEGVLDVIVTCNKKKVTVARGTHFKIVDYDDPSNIIRIPVNLPLRAKARGWCLWWGSLKRARKACVRVSRRTYYGTMSTGMRHVHIACRTSTVRPDGTLQPNTIA